MRGLSDALGGVLASLPRDYGLETKIPAAGRNTTGGVCGHTSFRGFEIK